MKTLHVLDFSTPAAGTFVVLKEIVERMVDQDIECHVLLLRNDKVGEKELTEIGAKVYFIDINNLVSIKKLSKIIPDIYNFSLIHIHGMYSYKIIMFSRLIKKINKPYVISTHGSLMNGGIENKSKFKKKIVLKTVLSKYIKESSYIHIQSEIESVEAIKFGANRTKIIPNGVTIIDIDKEDKPLNQIRALYLGRLDIHMKGLDKLVLQIKKYIKELDPYNFTLELVGPILTQEDKKFIEETIYKDEELNQIIKISEPVFEKEKWNKFNNADIFILPSRSECGTPLVLLEAMMVGCPCLITEESYASEIINKSNCGWVTNLEDDNLAKSLISVCRTSNESLKQMGNRAKTYCRMNFSWDDITRCYIEMYNEIIDIRKNK